MVETTRIMFGIVSKLEDGKHIFLADFDEDTEEQIMAKVGEILFDKYKFGRVYLVRSGRGYHLINFTERLTLEQYIKILEEMGADPKFIKILAFNGFGVLRFSKRDIVPFVIKVLDPPYQKQEDEFLRNFYLTMLELEKNYEPIWVTIKEGGKHGDKKS